MPGLPASITFVFGDGIAPENIPYIWDRYYKVDKKHKRAITGTGLGLSIVKKIFELHGAGYGVESELGKSSVFWFQLESKQQCNADTHINVNVEASGA